jgi:hypothetical protein
MALIAPDEASARGCVDSGRADPPRCPLRNPDCDESFHAIANAQFSSRPRSLKPYCVGIARHLGSHSIAGAVPPSRALSRSIVVARSDASAPAEAGLVRAAQLRQPWDSPGKVDHFGIVIAKPEPLLSRATNRPSAPGGRLGYCPFGGTHRCVAASTCMAGRSSGVGSSCQLSANEIVASKGRRRPT